MANYATFAAAHRAAVAHAADAGKALTLARHSLNAAGGDSVRGARLSEAVTAAEAAYRAACEEADQANTAASAGNPSAELSR